MQEERKRQRRTEQDDELAEEHSVAPQHERPENPYRPARQPAQQQPDEEGEEVRDTGF